MKIGCPTEIKRHEYRVGLVPSSVRELTDRGHQVLIQSGAGNAINFSDEDYINVGAEIAETAAQVFEKSEMIVKVKEPQPSEFELLREGQILFTYLHLAADKKQAEGLMKSGCVAIAYETVTDKEGRLPLLAPMSEIAGRLSIQVGAHLLQKHCGGTGRLIGGVPGVLSSKVLILGGGVSGFNAARIATGMEADVTILERNPDRMRFLDDYFSGRAQVVYSNTDTIERYVQEIDIVIGAVLIPGASAPHLIREEMLSSMIPGTVVVDVAIDQGGCFETSRPTTHDDPTFVKNGVLHYCVANMPGAVPLTSALHLNHAVLPYMLQIADHGWKKALNNNPYLAEGLNVYEGKITHKAVAESLNIDFCEKTNRPAA